MSQGINLKILPLSIEEFIKKHALDYDLTEFEIRDAYIIYLVENRNNHHYGEFEYLCKWLSNEEYKLIKGKY